MNLTFPHAELKNLYAKATEQWELEVKPLYGEVTGKGFWLVGDDGVYLMHNGKAHDDKTSDGKDKRQPLVYAKECNPETMDFDAWWDAKQDTWGGDDGVEFIEAKLIVRAINEKCDLAIRFKTDQFEITLVNAGAKA